MAPIQVFSLQNVVREKPKLPRCAPAFTVQSRCGQAGLGTTDLGDLIGPCLDLIGDGMQECRAFLAVLITRGPKRLFCLPRRPVDIACASDCVTMRAARGGIRSESLVSVDPIPCNQVLSMRFKHEARPRHSLRLKT